MLNSNLEQLIKHSRKPLIMKFLSPFFVAILISIFAFSQNPIENEIEFIKPITTLLGTDTVVQDSTVSRYYDEDGNLIVKAKTVTYYDASANQILILYYSWDEDAEQLFLRQKDSIVYTGNIVTEWKYKAQNSSSQLLPSGRKTKTYESFSTYPTLQINEYWDADLNDWQLYSQIDTNNK